MQEQLRYGSVGEFVVWNMFQHMNGIRQVVDVRDDERFQSYDVDYLIEDTKRQYHWIEVKTDSMAHRTGNLAYELESSSYYHTKGCLEKTKADIIAYFIPEDNIVHLINMPLLREYAHAAKFNKVKMGDNAIGFLIPITELEMRKIIYRTIKV